MKSTGLWFTDSFQATRKLLVVPVAQFAPDKWDSTLFLFLFHERISFINTVSDILLQELIKRQ